MSPRRQGLANRSWGTADALVLQPSWPRLSIIDVVHAAILIMGGLFKARANSPGADISTKERADSRPCLFQQTKPEKGSDSDQDALIFRK